MSEIVHYSGKLKPTGKTLKEYDSDAEDVCYLDDDVVEIDGQIFEVCDQKDISYKDLFDVSKNEDGSYNFNIKYYNGGCSFQEAIEEGLKILNNNE
jgi:hypothetical protein